MDAEIARLMSADFSLESNEGARLYRYSSSDYYRHIEKRISGYLFEKLKVDSLKLYCTGFDPASFTLVASIPPDGNRRVISTLDLTIDAVAALHKMSVSPTDPPSLKPYEFISNGRHLRIWLFARGEYFGFMELHKHEGFNEKDIQFMEDNASVIVRFLAEENFSFRMHILLEPLEAQEGPSLDEERFYQSVVRQVALGFGADGSTLRLLDGEQNTLAIKASEGHASGLISDDRQLGQMVSGKVFEGAVNEVAAILVNRPALDRGEIRITTVERARFAAIGITALVVGKLARKDSNGRVHGFGTLGYFFKRPHTFSRRDIDLFKAFCKRVSDAMFISQTFGDLQAQAAIQEAQSRRMTYIEVANLLAHDLWHKSFNASSAAEENIEVLQKLVHSARLRGSDTVLDEIKKSANTACELAKEVHTTSSNLHSLQIKPTAEAYKPELFSVLEVINSVEKTLKPALMRQKISLRKAISDSYQLFGPKLAFEQVVFNLIINSIDAAKVRSATRPMSIDIQGHIERDRLIIRYSDEGPGIDPKYFPNEQEVFDIGKTSKPEGTGTGLPVARQLIGTHFSGQLLLTKRRPPLFTIDVPLGKRS